MSATPSTAGGIRRRAVPSILALGVVMVVAGCQAAVSPSPSPSAAPSSSRAASPTAGRTASASPAPSATPAVSTPAGPGRWVDAGVLAGSPIAGPATVLGDGRVLVVGRGEDNESIAWLWDPATSAWSATAGLPKMRQSHALVTLADGRGLAIGGLNDQGQSFSSTYAFDPVAAQWTKTVVLAAGRTEPMAVVLRDGRVLVMGGFFQNGVARVADRLRLAGTTVDRKGGRTTPALDDVEPPDRGPAYATTELLDRAAGTVSAGRPMRFARAGALATVLADGRVLVVGSKGSEDGIRVDARAQSSAEVYDPTSGIFSITGSLPVIDATVLEKAGPQGANPLPDLDPTLSDPGTLVAVRDGGAVLIARSWYWKHEGDITRSFRYDAGTGRWSEIGQTYVYVGEPGPTALTIPGVRDLQGAAVAALHDGRVLIAGGRGLPTPVSGGFIYPTSDAAQLFDPAEGTFATAASMPLPRQNGGAATLRDGSILVFGGFSLTDRVPSVRFVPGG